MMSIERLRADRVEKVAPVSKVEHTPVQARFTEFQLRAMIVGLRMEIRTKREDGSFLRMSGKVAPIAICRRWGFKSRTRVKLYLELCKFATDNDIHLMHSQY